MPVGDHPRPEHEHLSIYGEQHLVERNDLVVRFEHGDRNQFVGREHIKLDHIKLDIVIWNGIVIRNDIRHNLVFDKW